MIYQALLLFDTSSRSVFAEVLWPRPREVVQESGSLADMVVFVMVLMFSLQLNHALMVFYMPRQTRLMAWLVLRKSLKALRIAWCVVS